MVGFVSGVEMTHPDPAALHAYTVAGGAREQPDSVLLSWTFSD